MEEKVHLLNASREVERVHRRMMIARTSPAVAEPGRQIDRAATVAVAVPGMLMAEALGRVLREARHARRRLLRDAAALLEKVRRCRPAVVIADAGLGDEPGGAAAMLWRAARGRPAEQARRADDRRRRPARARGDATRRPGGDPEVEPDGRRGAGAQARRPRPHQLPADAARAAQRAARRRGLSSRASWRCSRSSRKGRSNEEIARRLFISTNTVKFHLRAIYDRLGVHNRVEAAQLLAAATGRLRAHPNGWAAGRPTGWSPTAPPGDPGGIRGALASA